MEFLEQIVFCGGLTRVASSLPSSSSKDEEKKSEDIEAPPPSDAHVREIAKIVVKRVDVEDTSFKQFLNAVEKELNYSKLSSTKQAEVKTVFDNAHKGGDHDDDLSEMTNDVPSDAAISKAAKKLAYSSKIDLETISKDKFISILSERMSANLKPKKALISKIFLECKKDSGFDVSEEKIKDAGPAKAIVAPVMPVAPAVVSTPGAKSDHPTSFEPRENGFRHSEDLLHGRTVPDAAGHKWKDGFFDADFDELVAGFDHDWARMVRYYMTYWIWRRSLPTFVLLILVFVGLRVIQDNEFASTTYHQYVVMWAVFWLLLNLYGTYRLVRSQVYARHLAVVRDGVKTVYDDHLSGLPLLAAVHILDCCLRQSGVSEMVRTVLK